MKLYLSSYKFGDNPEKLTELFGANKRIGVIYNSLDFSSDLERISVSQDEQLQFLKERGLEPELIDLREYFNKQPLLSQKVLGLGGLWVVGGNTFVLNVAFQNCGLDNILRELVSSKKEFVYAGYSAGVCVLQTSLRGIEMVDDPSEVQIAYGKHVDVQWEGVGLLDYVFVPHFKSDHPESDDTDKEVAFYKANNIPYKTFRDGEVLIDEM